LHIGKIKTKKDQKRLTVVGIFSSNGDFNLLIELIIITRICLIQFDFKERLSLIGNSEFQERKMAIVRMLMKRAKLNTHTYIIILIILIISKLLLKKSREIG